MFWGQRLDIFHISSSSSGPVMLQSHRWLPLQPIGTSFNSTAGHLVRMTIINNLAKDLVLDQELCTLLTKDVTEAVNPLTQVRGGLLSLLPRAKED